MAGLVIDSGHQITSITPVFEGTALQHASIKVLNGGLHSWDRLTVSLAEQNKVSFNSTERNLLGEWAKPNCFYSLNYAADSLISEKLAGKNSKVSILDQYVFSLSPSLALSMLSLALSLFSFSLALSPLSPLSLSLALSLEFLPSLSLSLSRSLSLSSLSPLSLSL